MIPWYIMTLLESLKNTVIQDLGHIAQHYNYPTGTWLFDSNCILCLLVFNITTHRMRTSCMLQTSGDEQLLSGTKQFTKIQ